MNRRDLISVASAAVLVAAASPALAEEGHEAHEHAGHDHGVDDMPYQSLVDAATNCTKTGLACINHCLDSFAAGDTAMARCARAVDQMISVCGTLAKLASIGSSHLPAMAKIAADVCQNCEKECKKHADHHAVCKACAEACAKCAEECKKISA